MVDAAFWGFVGGFSLVLGAVAGLTFPTNQRVIGLIMAFGGGVLISAVAFELTEEAFVQGGADAVAAGLAGGSLAFFTGDWMIDRRGGNHRKRSGGQNEEGGGTAIALGALMDGIPESIAIGASLLAGNGVGVGAVFLSNIPESLSAAMAVPPATSLGSGARSWSPRRWQLPSATLSSATPRATSSHRSRHSPPERS